ncbi:tRNA-dihydrouridine synthase [Paenibacillus castaneae]|nr:tRNA-dihydrouridine synthase [Paenibacillus castaneae]
MRIGWDSDHIYAVENARAVERAGGKAVSVHGRTREQLYTGKANWDIIKEVKEAVRIPVIGNGDVFSPEEAKRLLDHTDHGSHLGELCSNTGRESRNGAAKRRIRNKFGCSRAGCSLV